MQWFAKGFLLIKDGKGLDTSGHKGFIVVLVS